jgi:transposase
MSDCPEFLLRFVNRRRRRFNGAHHLGRLFARQGHDVRLMSPEYVRPYVEAQKNDDRDAKGIAKAAPRPTMRFVEAKSQEQLDI